MNEPTPLSDAELIARIYASYHEMFTAKRRGEFPPESKPAPPTTYSGQPQPEPEQTDNDE